MKLKSGLAFTLFLTVLLAGFFPVSFISVSSGEFDCVSRTQNFSLRWRHSVEKQLWFEHYHWQQNHFELKESWLQTFGAGTPSRAESTDAPDGYIGYRHNVSYQDLNWTVSPRMEGTLLFDQQELLLYQKLPEYSVVHIQPEKSPFWFYLLRSSCEAATKRKNNAE